MTRSEPITTDEHTELAAPSTRAARARRSLGRWIAPDDETERTYRRVLLAITVAGFVIRLAFILLTQRDRPLTGDAWEYHYAAEGIARGHGYISPLALRTRGELEPTASHPPLWPMLLALLWQLGVRNMLSQLYVNLVIGTMTIPVVAAVGRRVGGVRIALFAAALAAVYPNLWGWDGRVLSEPLATFFVTLAILLAYRYRDAPTLRNVALLTGAVALALLTRAEQALLLVVLVAPLLLRAHWRDWRPLARAIAASGLVLAVLWGPWIVYNESRFERHVLLTTTQGKALAAGACDLGFYGPLTGFWSLKCLSGVEPQAKKLGYDESQRDQLFYDKAMAYYGDNRSRIPLVLFARVGRTFHFWEPDQQIALDEGAEGRHWVEAGGGIGMYFLLAPAAIAGTAMLLRREEAVLPLLAPFAAVVAASLYDFGTTRLRAPAEGALCVLGAVGLAALLDVAARVRARRGRTGADAGQAGEPDAPADPPRVLLAQVVAVAVLGAAALGAGVAYTDYRNYKIEPSTVAPKPPVFPP